MPNETEHLTADTTFYALTAPLPGYTLEDQVLGPRTLREWLHWIPRDEEDAQEFLVERLVNGRFFASENDAWWEILHDDTGRYGSETKPEAFTPASLLARLREMGEEANEG